ncbi:FAM210B isoform 2, partial [Pan troglodytes]
PLTLALLPPRPDARLLRTARGDCRGHQSDRWHTGLGDPLQSGTFCTHRAAS